MSLPGNPDQKVSSNSTITEFDEDIKRLTQNFTGRDWVISKLNNWQKSGQSRAFLITGGPGTGKSVFAARLAQLSRRDMAFDGSVQLEPGCRAFFNFHQTHPDSLTFFHFCQARNDRTLEPLRFVRALSHQLANRYPEFARALLQIGDQDINVNVAQSGTVQSGGQMTGVVIKDLHISNLSARIAFERVVRQPLEQLYAGEFNATILILVDSLDEALTYNPSENIANLLGDILDDAMDFPDQVRFVLTSRPDPRVQHILEKASLEPLDLVNDAPPDVDDICEYAYRRLATLVDPQRMDLARRITKLGKGNFLYAHYVLDDLTTNGHHLENPEDLTLPEGLDDVYRQFLKREIGRNLDLWDERYRPLLGVLAVARGDGLTKQHIVSATGISKSQAGTILRACTQYIVGPQPDGPFHIYHQSFREFLFTDETYSIYPGEANEAIAKYYLERLGNDRASWDLWDDYGLRYVATHLLEGARESSQPSRHQLTQLLVHLESNPRFHEFYQQRLKDLPALQRDVDLALRSACTNNVAAGLPLVVEMALAAVAFRREWLRPAAIFALAREGEVEAAQLQANLFTAEPEWQQAILLTIAWLAAARRPDKARALRDRVAARLSDAPTLQRLLQRVNATMNGDPLPDLPLPEAPPEDVVRAIVARMGAEIVDSEGHLNPQTELLISYGLKPAALNSALVAQGELFGQGRYIAEQDGPYLVAYAVKHGEEGEQYLKQYIAVHTAYNYAHYRNRSLWALLDAVLLHPKQEGIGIECGYILR